jgi:hypothetical protein
MSIVVVGEYLVAAALVWITVASFAGVFRFDYRPLLLSALGSGLMSIASVSRALDRLEHPMPPLIGACHYFGMLCVAIYLTRFRDALRQRGISRRQLLFFTRK